MSLLGPIEAASWFAVLHSASMGGYGVPIVAAWVKGTAATAAAAIVFRAYLKSARRGSGTPKL